MNENINSGHVYSETIVYFYYVSFCFCVYQIFYKNYNQKINIILNNGTFTYRSSCIGIKL